MKKHIIIYLIAILMVGSSCQDFLLDREPLDKIAESAVFTSAPLIEANLTIPNSSIQAADISTSIFGNGCWAGKCAIAVIGTDKLIGWITP